MRRKDPKYSLKKYYTVLLEGGIVVALLIMLAAFTIRMPKSENNQKMVEKQETVKMEDVVQTKQEETPPPPPKPQVPVEVPNDEVVQEQDFNFGSELNMDQKLDVPPPPKEAKKEDKEEQVFVVVENQPKLKGGLAALQQKINYPDMARKAGIEGRVYVQFIVDKHGNVVNPHVIRGIGGGCDKEALRVIKKAKFTPGMQRGRPVKVKMSLPIVFKLQG